MLLLYQIAIQLYFFVACFLSIFNQKAKLWIAGRKKIIPHTDNLCIWFHFASLGEFEQGRPVLENIRALYPNDKVVITFFSPSGYEIRKNTPLADAVYYLPLDTEKNAESFIDAINPKLAIFTKYEYWYYYFNEMNKREVPVYIISGIFRPRQIFFKWYGPLHRKVLGFVNYFFVQDEQSKQLLQVLGIDKVMVSGDTRFDRVWENALHPKSIPYLTEFKNNQKIFIAGSTWSPDEKLVANLISEYPGWKFIFAPHEIGEEKIKNLIAFLPHASVARYSQIAYLNSPIANINVLIIDNIGMLSALYQYADIAYIGGGFGAGIHNTLEAAAFGIPVIFGPNYSKFKEANDLIDLKAGFSITNGGGLKEISNKLFNDETFYKNASEKASNYVESHTGATKVIIDYLTLNKI